MLPVRPYTDEEVQGIVATDIDFRQKSGLRADRAHVEALVLAHDYTKSVPKFLIAATPEEEAELDLGNTLRAEVGALGKELAERQGSDFGGSYVDPRTGRVVVWSVDNRLSRPEIEQRLSLPARLELRHARHSQGWLDSATREVAGLLAQLQTEGFPVSGVGTDLFTNSVQLIVDSHGDQGRLRQRLGKELDLQMFTFIVGRAEPSGDLHGGTDWDPPGFLGGTKGFDAYQAGSWKIYALTAGHLPDHTLTFAGHTMYRAATLFANNSTTDVAAFHMQPTYQEYWNHNSGYVWHGNPSILIGVSGWDHIGNPYNDQVGAQVCMSGHTPEYRSCSYITMLNKYVTYLSMPRWGTRSIWVRQANYPCISGVSGGPVWGWSWPTVRAVGTQSGQNAEAPTTVGEYQCWYTHLDNALYPWGLTDVIKHTDA